MKVGLIGYGYWGAGFVARNIARMFDLAVIVDPDPLKLVEASHQWGPWGTKVSSEPIVAIEECDAVWIATPASTHPDIVREALMHGTHVLCEKPFVMSSLEAQSLCGVAEDMDVALMVGHVQLYTRAQVRLREALEKPGKIIMKRHTVRPSISDHSVLWGLGPHDIASLIDVLGPPDLIDWRGNTHRVEGDLRWNRGDEAWISLDWLAAQRDRLLYVSAAEGGSSHNLATVVDPLEPLLAEAIAFRTLCDTPELRERALIEAVGVTKVLETASRQIENENASTWIVTE